MRILSLALIFLMASSCACATRQPAALAQAAKTLTKPQNAVIATQLVSVMTKDWLPVHHKINIQASVPEFEAALRQAGYGIVNAGFSNAITAQLKILSITNDLLNAILLVNETWQLGRLYKSIEGRLEPVNGYTLGGGRGIRGPVLDDPYYVTDTEWIEEAKIKSFWYINIAESVDKTQLETSKIKVAAVGLEASVQASSKHNHYVLRLGPYSVASTARYNFGLLRREGFDQSRIIAAKEAEVVGEFEPLANLKTPRPCWRLAIGTGSLRDTVTNLVQDCGYKMGEWRLRTGAQVADWVIRTPYYITSQTGIWGLLELLQTTYGIVGKIDLERNLIHFEGNK